MYLLGSFTSDMYLLGSLSHDWVTKKMSPNFSSVYAGFRAF